MGRAEKKRSPNMKAPSQGFPAGGLNLTCRRLCYRAAAPMQPAKAAMAKVNRAAPATMVIMADLLSVRRGNLFRRPAFVRNNFDETTMTALTYHPLARPLQKCRFRDGVRRCTSACRSQGRAGSFRVNLDESGAGLRKVDAGDRFYAVRWLSLLPWPLFSQVSAIWLRESPALRTDGVNFSKFSATFSDSFQKRKPPRHHAPAESP